MMEQINNNIYAVQQAQPVSTVDVLSNDNSQEQRRKYLNEKQKRMKVSVQLYHIILSIEVMCFLLMLFRLFPFFLSSFLTVFVLPSFIYTSFFCENQRGTINLLQGYLVITIVNAILHLLSIISQVLFNHTVFGFVVKSALLLLSTLAISETDRILKIELGNQHGQQNQPPTHETIVNIVSESIPVQPVAQDIPLETVICQQPSPNDGIQQQTFLPNDNNPMEQLYNHGFTDFEKNFFYLNKYNGDVKQVFAEYARNGFHLNQDVPLLPMNSVAVPDAEMEVPFEKSMEMLYDMGFTDFEKNHFYLTKFNGDIEQVLSAYNLK